MNKFGDPVTTVFSLYFPQCMQKNVYDKNIGLNKSKRELFQNI